MEVNVTEANDLTTMPPDFASAEYWTERFQQEEHFEWLAVSDELMPLIEGYVQEEGEVHLLHFGAGTSTLGRDLVEVDDTGRLHVVDADYVDEVMSREDGEGRYSRIALDVVSPEAMKAAAPPDGWDLYVDKSTADAISCGPDEDFEALCENLAACGKPVSTWISISYSSTRFDDVQGWKVDKKIPLRTTGGQNGSVWEPEVVAVWAYILSRR